MNDLVLEENKDYRIGKRRELESEDLILWIDHKSVIPSKIVIKEKM